MHAYDLIIIGAGAAGLFCAIEAGRGGKRVLLLDHADRAGKKILISGGGRCNFTNLNSTPANFLSANPHFAKSALARYTPQDFVALVEAHGIPYHEKAAGQLFCDGPAQQIVTMLERECRDAGVDFSFHTRITQIRNNNGYVLEDDQNRIWAAPRLVIATGGPAIPRMGATRFGYEVAARFGLKLVADRPALVPLTFAPEDRARFCDLAGVATEVVATTGNGAARTRFRDKLLITHRGLSGPAVLQVSSYWKEGSSIAIDLAPEQDFTATLRTAQARRDQATARAALSSILPQRLAARWTELYPPAGWSNQALLEADARLHRWVFTPAGTEGYEKAEVTAGGVDTTELSAGTMEARKVPGLYFIGEVVDVTGHLGGHNFQWAWASGAAAGRNIAAN